MYFREVDHLQRSTANSTGTDVTMWNMDPAHTSITFSVRHMMIANVRGEFKGGSGRLRWNPAKPEESSVEVSVDTASISTGEE